MAKLQGPLVYCRTLKNEVMHVGDAHWSFRKYGFGFGGGFGFIFFVSDANIRMLKSLENLRKKNIKINIFKHLMLIPSIRFTLPSN